MKLTRIHTLSAAPTAAKTPSPMLTVPEAAAYLRVCDKTIRKLARDGRLRSVRVGNRIRFREADIAAFASGRQI